MQATTVTVVLLKAPNVIGRKIFKVVSIDIATFNNYRLDLAVFEVLI